MFSLVPHAFATLTALLVVPCVSPQDQEGKPVLIGSLEHEANVKALHFSDDGGTLTALVFQKEKAVRWDLKEMKRRSVVDLSTPGLITSASFSSDGRLLLTRFTVHWARDADEERKLGEWARVSDLETGKEKAAYHGRFLFNSNLSPDGKFLAVIEGYEPLIENPFDVMVLEVVAGKEALVVPGKKGTKQRPLEVKFSPDGKTLALAIYDFEKRQAAVELWEVSSRKVRATLTGLVDQMLVLFSPDGRTIATWASNDNVKRPPGEPVKVELKLWHADTGREKAELKGHKQPIFKAAFSPDGKFLATGTMSLELGALLAPPELVGRPASKTELKLWDVAAGKERAAADLLENERMISHLMFSPDGRLFASYSAHGALRLWDAASCKRLPCPREWDNLSLDSLAFSPDAKVLAIAEGEKGIVSLWDISSLGMER
jgi:WD40 repeat protein